MLKIFFFSALLLTLSGGAVRAQNVCGTPSPSELPADQRAAFDRIEAQTQQYAKQLANGTAQRPAPGGGDQPPGQFYITLPVVVHVVHNLNNPAENISDAQITAQIASLNRDFARTNTDAGNTPSAFRGVAADMGIRFQLATHTPTGDCTNGIVRVETPDDDFATTGVDRMKSGSGGSPPWDQYHYINIWVCDLRPGDGFLGGTIVGYSTLPASAGYYNDGIVVDYEYFGPTGTPNYNLGRTLTHEMGHYLNLLHIWGDGWSNPCAGDDLVSDTPTQNAANQGCPSFPSVSCTASAPNGDMFMNYMDYTFDGCKNLFTAGQSTRSLSLFQPGGARASLLSSRAFTAPLAPTIASVPPLSFCNGGVYTIDVLPVCGAVSYTFKMDPVDYRSGFVNNNSISDYVSTNLTSPSAQIVLDGWPAYTKTVCVKANFADGSSTGAACQTFKVVNPTINNPTATLFQEGTTCYYGLTINVDPNVDDYGVTVNGGGTRWKLASQAVNGVLTFLLHIPGPQTVSVQLEARNTCGSNVQTLSLKVPRPPEGCVPTPIEGGRVLAGGGTGTPNVATTRAAARAALSSETLSVAPNPATTEVLVSRTSASGPQEGLIRSLTGQVVKRFTLGGATATTVGIAELSEGLYLVEVTGPNGSERTRLVVTRP